MIDSPVVSDVLSEGDPGENIVVSNVSGVSVDPVRKSVDSLELPVGNGGKEYVVVDGSTVDSDEPGELEFVRVDVIIIEVSDSLVESVEGVENDDNVELSIAVDEMVEVMMIDVKSLVRISDVNEGVDDDVVSSEELKEREELDDSDDGDSSVDVESSIVVLPPERVNISGVVSVKGEVSVLVDSEVLFTKEIELDTSVFVDVDESAE